MNTPPENSSSLVPRGGALLLLVLAVGAGMYLLGRRSHASPPTGDGQTSPTGAATSTSGRHLAPHDTFYVLQYVAVKTPTGVTGFEPGQAVHLVAVHQPTRTLVVGDGQAQVEVGPDQLTNDMDIAALVRQKDQANQAKIAEYVQAEQKAYNDSQRTAAVDTAKDIEKINKQERESSTVNADNSKLSQRPVEVAGTTGYGGYGSVGSASYGSPYSYFSGGATTTTGTATTGTTGTSTAPAATGTSGGTSHPGGGH